MSDGQNVGRTFTESTMWRFFTKTLEKVGTTRPCGSVRSCASVTPVSAAPVAGRRLTRQDGLPRLPVPPLRQTCERYLAHLEPIVEAEELRRTKELVEDFQKPGGVGEILQRGLERRARTTENWLTDMHVQAVYLNPRVPVVVYTNVGIVLPRMVVRNKQEQIRCAAKLIASALDLKEMIDNETLPVESLRGQPLCMEQHKQVWSSCCIPGPERDSVVYHDRSSSPPKHITVVHNSQFFTLDVYDGDGTPLTVDQLCVQLERIWDASLQTSTEPVGILTTQDRRAWNKTYVNLMKDETNKESVSAIERSMFMVCLDGPTPRASDKMYSNVVADQMMYGGGSQWNSGNRWFDKTLHLIIGEDGECGVNCSHAVADGTVVISVSDYIGAYINRKRPKEIQTPMASLPMPQKLHFNITPDIKKNIEEAKKNMDILTQDLHLNSKVFHHFGKEFLKTHNMSTDAFIQMALQLAYYRMFQRHSRVIEACSQRMFRLGRLSTISATSSASAAFVKAFDDLGIRNTEKIDLLKKAVKVHISSTCRAMSGQSSIEHLFGLETLAVEGNISMPDIFTDASYSKISNYDLSTSQVFSKIGCLPFTCIDSVNGYNVVYIVMEDHIRFIVIDLNKEASAAHLFQTVEDALLDMKLLLEQHSEAQRVLESGIAGPVAWPSQREESYVLQNV